MVTIPIHSLVQHYIELHCREELCSSKRVRSARVYVNQQEDYDKLEQEQGIAETIKTINHHLDEWIEKELHGIIEYYQVQFITEENGKVFWEKRNFQKEENKNEFVTVLNERNIPHTIIIKKISVFDIQ